MSLINRMLQDLEERRAAGTELGNLAGDVRPLPQEGPPVLRMPLAIGLVAVLAIAVVVLFWPDDPQPAGQAIRPIAQNAPVPPAPALAVPAAAAPAISAAAGTAPAPAAEEPKPADPPAAVPLEAFRAEPARPREAAAKPEPRKSVAAGRHSETGLKVTTVLSFLPEVTERPIRPPAASAPQGGRPSIEKQMRTGTAGERAEADYRKAVGLLNLGRHGEASENLRNALRADPAHAGARLMLAGMLMEQKHLDEAQGVLAEGLTLNPSHPELAMRLARIQVERGDSAAAIDILRKAAPAATANADYRGFHAAVLQRLNRHGEAVPEFQAALQLVPQSGVWWMGLGLSLEAENRTAEAREAFQKARGSGTLSTDLEQFVGRKLRQLQ